jgi:hypothetical protein
MLVLALVLGIQTRPQTCTMHSFHLHLISYRMYILGLLKNRADK